MRKLTGLGLVIAVLLSMTSSFAGGEIFTGSTVNVVAIGGSITAGAGASDVSKCWVSLVGNYMKQRFADKTVNVYNAGVGGTGSDLGIFRLSNDVISRNPDYVFVEFAVNDSGRVSLGQSDYVIKHMEGIVRQLLKLPKKPYITFVYTTTDKKIACTSTHQQVADYYGIPSIDLQDYVFNTYFPNNPGVTSSQFFVDGVHPTDLGYQVYADYIISKLRDHETDYYKYATWKDTPMSGFEFNHPSLVPYTRAKFTGNWALSSYANIGNVNQAMTTSTVGDKVEIYFTGKCFGILGSVSANGGQMSYDIDNGAKSGNISQYYTSTIGINCSYYQCDLGEGWHKAVFTVKQPTNGASGICTIALFMIDREDAPPIGVTGVTAGNETSVRPIIDGTVNLPTGTDKVIIIFNTYLDIETINPSSIIVTQNNQNVSYTGLYNMDERKFIMQFPSALANDIKYTVTIPNSIKSQGIANDGNISFCMGSSTKDFVINSVVFSSLNGVRLQRLSDARFVKTTVSVTNNRFESAGAVVVVALYKDNKLSRIASVSNSSIKAGATKDIEAGISLPADSTGYSLKAFIWDSLNTKNIISEVRELN